MYHLFKIDKKNLDAYLLVSWYLCDSGLQVRDVFCIESHLKRPKSAARPNHRPGKGKMASIFNIQYIMIQHISNKYIVQKFWSFRILMSRYFFVKSLIKIFKISIIFLWSTPIFVCTEFILKINLLWPPRERNIHIYLQIQSGPT